MQGGVSLRAFCTLQLLTFKKSGGSSLRFMSGCSRSSALWASPCISGMLLSVREVCRELGSRSFAMSRLSRDLQHPREKAFKSKFPRYPDES